MSQLSPARSPTLSDMEEADSPTVKVKRDISTATPPPQPKPQPQRMSRYLPPDARDAFIGPLPPTTLETIKLIKAECPSLTNVPSNRISLAVRFDGETQRAVKDVLFRVVPEAWPGAVSDVLPLIHVNVRNHTPLPMRDMTPSPLPSPALPGAATPGADVKAVEVNTVVPTPVNLPSPLAPTVPSAAQGTIVAAAGEAETQDGQTTTWGDLKREGTLLGVWGWTDQARSQPGE